MVTEVQDVQRVDRPVTEAGTGVAQHTVARTETRDSANNIVARVIGFIGAVLLILLAFRFVLVLLGANTANGFANFVYSTSHPFVAPFFSLFSYNTSYGASRFEMGTLVAIVVYALVTYGLMRLATINRPSSTV